MNTPAAIRNAPIRRHRTFNFETKELKADGEFTGYASVFDTVDFYKDVIRRGAFTDTLAAWKARDKLPPLLWMHRSDSPIGAHLEMREDDRGLFVRAKLLIDDVQQARETYALLKAKVISGMSIGFDVAEGGQTFDGKLNIWNLTKLDLWENSVVTFPANEDAQVEQVKTALAGGTLPPPSDFEGFLRDAGFTRSQAKLITSKGYTSLRDAGLDLRDEGDETTPELLKAVQELANYL